MRTCLLLALAPGCSGPDEEDPPPGGPPTLIASSSATVEVSYPDLAYAPDGTLWVSWVELDDSDRADVFVVASRDGGRTFSDPVQADGDVDELFLGAVRQPVLAVDGERVALVVGGGTYVTENTILLFVASTAAPVFETQVLAAAVYDPDPADPGTITLVDQPELMFDLAGELWVNWKQGTFYESFQLVLAQEGDGFAPEPLNDGVAGEPCECCPTDFLQYPDGEVLLAFRNNELNLREIWLGAAPDGERFAEAFQVSTTGWVIPGCPLDGPSITRAGDALVATWADASAGDNYQWMAVSHDRGRGWTPSFRVEPDNGESVTWPQVATAPDGVVWTSVEEIFHGANLSSTADLGATFTAHPAEAPSGPVFFPEIAAGPDEIGLVGVTEEGELWFLAVSR